MRLIKAALVAAVVATASLAAAGTAQAAQLARFSFVGEAGVKPFVTAGTNVRVSYRCTSRTRKGFVQVTHSYTGFRRRAPARCDGVPRSVLLRTMTGDNVVLLQQGSYAYAAAVVYGTPCPTAEC